MMKFHLLLVLAATFGFVQQSHSYFRCNLDEYESESSCKLQCRFPINEGNSSIPGRCAISYSFEPKNAPPKFNPIICWKCYNDRHPSMINCTPNVPKCPEAQSSTLPVTNSPSTNWKYGLPKPYQKKPDFPTTPSPMHNWNKLGSMTTNFEGRDLPEPESLTTGLPSLDKDWEAEFTPFDMDEETDFTTPDLDEETDFTTPDLDEETDFTTPGVDDETDFTGPDVEATDFPEYETTEPDFPDSDSPPPPYSEPKIESDESTTSDSQSYETETSEIPLPNDLVHFYASNSTLV